MSDDAVSITWLEAAVPSPFRLVFTRRYGGASAAPYDTLNLGFNTGDDPRCVLENRARLSERLAIAPERWTLVRQVHSSRVIQVDGAGAGSKDYESGLADADAMITRESGPALCVLTADCVPVAIYGGTPPVIALVHSGWRGTLEGIAGAALEEMERRFQINPGEMAATLGPGIRSCCYAVDEERHDLFRQRFGAEKGSDANLDLFRAIRLTLLRAGVDEGRIVDTGICTHCDRDYFSFRRNGTTGRQAALLWIERGNG